jgi:8-oxo-dGTP pyrophosphatase MutT (NUDIX family)
VNSDDRGGARPNLNLLTKPADPPSAPARKSIPRPPHHRAGSPAPWAALAADDRRTITLDRVLSALADPGHPTGPGDSAGPEPWRTLPSRDFDGRPAAVLVPLFEESGQARVILTVRSDRLRSHQGEVAFPGGRLDGGEGVVAGALREAFEEVGLDPALVTVVGELTAMPTVSSNTVMTPVVATLDARPALVANPGEVERVFDVALGELAADGVFHEEWWSVPGRPAALASPEGEFPVWFFEVAGETVWGATARTLVELICSVLGVAVPSSLPSR